MISITVPGSKSITNRALLAASLAKGKTKLINVLESDDTNYMRHALHALGVESEKRGEMVTIRRGGYLHAPRKALFCGNAGTAVRFLTAVLATEPFASIIDGDRHMRRRPMRDLLHALHTLGASAISMNKNDSPPVKVQGPLQGGICRLSGTVSSQFLSGLLLAAPLAKREVTILIKGNLVSKPYVDMTIEVMSDFGVSVQRQGYKKFFIKSGQQYHPVRTFTIEGDASSASYFWGIGALVSERINVTNIPKNSKQADMEFLKAIQKLSGRNARRITFDGRNYPDAAMTLAVLCAFKKGKFRLTGLANLRVKECDRLAALKTELSKIGAEVKEEKDGLLIAGDPEKLHGALVETYHDHRMAMCFGMASVVIPEIKIKNHQCVQKTYPNFWKDLEKIKEQLREKNIVLTGMRGSGKTELGKVLAKKLKRRFIDLDKEIEKQAHMTIAHIVRQYGWKVFRKFEHKMVQKLHTRKKTVIATGGGTLMRKTNEQMFKKNGKIIFLQCTLNVLKKRLLHKKDRPSLTNKKNFLDELAMVYAKRKERYTQVADTMIDASHNNLAKKAKKILATIRWWGIS